MRWRMSNKLHRRTAKLLFEQWKSSLLDRDLTVNSLADNFDDLFFEFDKHNISFDVAREYLDLAIAAHLPSKRILNFTYRRVRHLGMSIEEFYEGWKERIRSEATNVFYMRYPLENQGDKNRGGLPNGMSKREYVRQRSYANSFPQLDLSAIPDLNDISLDDNLDILGQENGEDT